MDDRTRTAFRAFMALCGVIGAMVGGIVVAIVGVEIGLGIILSIGLLSVVGTVYSRAQGWL